MSWSNFKDNLETKPKFKEVVDEVCLYDLDAEIGMVAHFGKWYKMGVTPEGIPYPTSEIQKTDGIDDPPARFSIYGILDGMGENETSMKYSLYFSLFENHGPKPEEWIEISDDGSCNVPVTVEYADALEMSGRIHAWLSLKPKDNIGIRICDISTTPCTTGFDGADNSPCPFAKVYHVKSRCRSSCRTLLLSGIPAHKVEDELAELYVDIARGKKAEMSTECKMALLALLAFYESKC